MLSRPFGTRPSSPALLAAIGDGDAEVRAHAAVALGHQDNGAAIPALLAALEDGSPSVRREAARALGELGDTSADAALVMSLNDREASVRTAVAEALGHIGDSGVVLPLLGRRSDESQPVRHAAIAALSEIGDEAAVDGLLRWLWSEDLGDHPIELLRELGRHGDPRFVPVIASYFRDPDRLLYVRREAAFILAATGEPSARPYLTVALRDDSPPIREAAATALGELGDARSVPALVRLLHDESRRGKAQRDRTVLPPYVCLPLRELTDHECVEMAAREAIKRIAQWQALKTIRFAAYYPREVIAASWRPLRTYVHRSEAASVIENDARDPLTHISICYNDFMYIQCINEEGWKITVTPRLDGLEFHPPSITLGFYKDWHRVDFQLRASSEWAGRGSSGSLEFAIEGLLVSVIPLTVRVVEGDAGAEICREISTPYRAVFCSYSHRDRWAIQRAERIFRMLGGDEYLCDVMELRCGHVPRAGRLPRVFWHLLGFLGGLLFCGPGPARSTIAPS